MVALRGCACALALLSALALCAAQFDKRAAEFPPAPFVLGTRYGRSAPRHIAPRNDRFFMGSRYGKRSPPTATGAAVQGEGDSDSDGEAHQLAARSDRFFMSRYGRQQPGGGGGAALLCELPGVLPLLRCRLDRRLAPAPEPSAAED